MVEKTNSTNSVKYDLFASSNLNIKEILNKTSTFLIKRKVCFSRTFKKNKGL